MDGNQARDPLKRLRRCQPIDSLAALRERDHERFDLGVGGADAPDYDADRSRGRLIAQDIEPCIPSRKTPIPQDRTLYRQRHTIENMFGKLEDRRRIHTR